MLPQIIIAVCCQGGRSNETALRRHFALGIPLSVLLGLSVETWLGTALGTSLLATVGTHMGRSNDGTKGPPLGTAV